MQTPWHSLKEIAVNHLLIDVDQFVGFAARPENMKRFSIHAKENQTVLGTRLGEELVLAYRVSVVKHHGRP